MSAIIRPYKSKWTEHLRCWFWDGFCLRFLPVLIGLPLGAFLMVPLGLFFRKEIDKEDERFKESLGEQYKGWKYVRLPKLFFPWDNSEVGILGDHTWPERAIKKDPTNWLSMYIWLAWRNPVNNLQQLIGIDIDEKIQIYYDGDLIVDNGIDAPKPGSHFVKCINKGRTYYGYYLVKRYERFPNKCLRIRIGYKVKPTLNVAAEIAQRDKIGNAFIIAVFKSYGPDEQRESIWAMIKRWLKIK